MTREEKLERLEQIKQEIFNIEIGSDFLSFEDHSRLRELYTEKRELQAELEATCQGKAEGFCDVCMEKRCQGDEY